MLRAEGHMRNSPSVHTCCSCCSATAAPCFGLEAGCSPAEVGVDLILPVRKEHGSYPDFAARALRKSGSG
eukprot:11904047-Alexandrium_andersonii.AAC.1